jgi:hypothetical protein
MPTRAIVRARICFYFRTRLSAELPTVTLSAGLPGSRCVRSDQRRTPRDVLCSWRISGLGFRRGRVLLRHGYGDERFSVSAAHVVVADRPLLCLSLVR